MTYFKFPQIKDVLGEFLHDLNKCAQKYFVNLNKIIFTIVYDIQYNIIKR